MLSDPDRSVLLVIEALRRDAETNPPEPRLELAEIFRGGFGAVAPVLAAPEPTRTSRSRVLARAAFTKLAGLGLVAQLGLGAAAGATGLTVAAAGDTLPTGVQDTVASVLESVAPFVDVPDSGDRDEQAPGRLEVTPGQSGETPAQGAEPPGHREEPGNSGNAPAWGRDGDPSLRGGGSAETTDDEQPTSEERAPGKPAEGEERGNGQGRPDTAGPSGQGNGNVGGNGKARSGR